MNKTAFKYSSTSNLHPNYSLTSKNKGLNQKINNSFTRGFKRGLSPQNESTNESRLKNSLNKGLNRTRSASNKRNNMLNIPLEGNKRLISGKKQNKAAKFNFSHNILPGFKAKKDRKTEKSISTVYYTLFTDLMDSQHKIGVCDYKGVFDCLIGSFDKLSKVDDKFKNIAQILRIYLDSECEDQEIKRITRKNSKLEEKIAKLTVSLSELKRDNSIKAKNIRLLKNKTKSETIDTRVGRKIKEKLENKATQLENENIYLRQMLDEKAKELNLSLKKERKLVKIVYNLHKKGFPVEEMVEEESESDLSRSTVYFPDKVEMRRSEQNIPGLNFENLEEYASSEERASNKGNKGFNGEFMDCVEDFSKSWRKQVEATKTKLN